MTYQVIRFIFFVIIIVLFFIFIRKYIVEVTLRILKEEQFSIDAKKKKTVKDIKHIKIARIVFFIIGFAVTASAYLPIKDYAGSFSFDGWGITSFTTSILLFVLGVAIIIFTGSNKFESKFNSIVTGIFNYNYFLIENEKDDFRIIEKADDDNIYTYYYNYSLIENENKVVNNNEYFTDIVFRDDIDPALESQILFHDKKITEKSIENFELLSSNKEIKDKIEWISEAEKSKQVEYKSLFSYLHNRLENGLYPISTERRKKLCNFICSNFFKEGKDFEYKRVNRVFGEWLGMIETLS